MADPSQADVLVLNGVFLTPPRLRPGWRPVLVSCSSLAPDLSAQAVQTAFRCPARIGTAQQCRQPDQLPLNDPLVKQIIWNGAPQVRERSNIMTPMNPSSHW